MARSVIREFERAFERRAEVLADAPGRVNLIGEHTDYHEGFVLPMAVDLRTCAVAASRDDGLIRIRSKNAGIEVTATWQDLRVGAFRGPAAYLLGPFWALREQGLCAGSGADVYVRGDVPFGGGLSSSASVQVALVALAATMNRVALSPQEIARLARRSENEFCGVPCGVMDQVASACGIADHAIRLDCRTLDAEPVPVPRSWAVVVADSGVRHSVAGPEYRRRQAECEQGLAVARRLFPNVRTARDLTDAHLEQIRSQVPEVSYRRLRHVIRENERVLQAVAAMRDANASAMGSLLFASHESLARDYEVSCEELDRLVEVASGLPGLIGARLTGAGFGGNTVNLVERDHAESFCAALADRLRARGGRSIWVRIVEPSRGATSRSLLGD